MTMYLLAEDYGLIRNVRLRDFVAALVTIAIVDSLTRCRPCVRYLAERVG